MKIDFQINFFCPNLLLFKQFWSHSHDFEWNSPNRISLQLKIHFHIRSNINNKIYFKISKNQKINWDIFWCSALRMLFSGRVCFSSTFWIMKKKIGSITFCFWKSEKNKNTSTSSTLCWCFRSSINCCRVNGWRSTDWDWRHSNCFIFFCSLAHTGNKNHKYWGCLSLFLVHHPKKNASTGIFIPPHKSNKLLNQGSSCIPKRRFFQFQRWGPGVFFSFFFFVLG